MPKRFVSTVCGCGSTVITVPFHNTREPATFGCAADVHKVSDLKVARCEDLADFVTFEVIGDHTEFTQLAVWGDPSFLEETTLRFV